MDFLDLVEHEQRAAASRLTGRKTRGVPLLRDPLAPAQRRLVGARVVVREPGGLGHPAHQRGLTDLARAGDHLDEATALAQTPGEHGAVRTREHGAQFTQYVELIYSMPRANANQVGGPGTG